MLEETDDDRFPNYEMRAWHGTLAAEWTKLRERGERREEKRQLCVVYRYYFAI